MASEFDKNQLKEYIEKIEKLEEEKKELADLVSDHKTMLKSFGYDVKIINQILRYRKKSKLEQEEESTMFNLYLDALNG